MTELLRVLLVDTDPELLATAEAALEREESRLEVVPETSIRGGRDRLANGDIDCVVSGFDLAEADGLEFLERVREDDPHLPFILFTDEGNEEIASDAISAGVTDYLRKHSETDQYAILAKRIVNHVKRRRAQTQRQRQLDAIETAQEGISILDENGTFIYVNQAYADLYGYEPEEMLGEHWELIYRDEDVQEIYDEVLPTVDETGGWHGETIGVRADGSTFIEDHRLATTEYGEIVCTIRDITEREKREQAIRDAYEVIANPDLSFDEQVESLLELVRETIGTDYATLSRVNGNEYVYEYIAAPADADLQAGDSISLEATNCERVIATEQSLVLRDVDADAPELADKAGNAEWGISCYLGVPVTVGDDVYGTFCFYGMEERAEEFADWEVTFVELLGNWVSQEIGRQRKTEHLAALDELHGINRDINRELARQTTREEIERVVCERLANSDSYEFAWIGTVDDESREVIPSMAANTQGYLDEVTITADDSPTGRGPCGTAVRTGETQVVQDIHETTQFEPWRDQASQRGINAMASTPIAHEGQHYGTLSVYTGRNNAFDSEEREVVAQLGEIIGLAITAVDREEELEHERERLEFINRLVRHNLLNSLNVVGARSEIIDSHIDPEAQPHLETIKERTEKMTDLIQTLRSLMKAIVSEEEYEREAVDLGDVLRTEVTQSRRAFDHAQFEIRDDLDQIDTVLANDLVEEVFENLLTNAVQHNDKETPRVTIDVEQGADMVTVHIGDNGPGIPDDKRERIFQKGEKGFESPGTGFGLHLVREIVDACDGRITVENKDPSGSVFSVSFPRTSAQKGQTDQDEITAERQQTRETSID